MSNQYDAVVIGAGVSGLYACHKLRERGLSVRVLEAGSRGTALTISFPRRTPS